MHILVWKSTSSVGDILLFHLYNLQRPLRNTISHGPTIQRTAFHYYSLLPAIEPILCDRTGEDEGEFGDRLAAEGCKKIER